MKIILLTLFLLAQTVIAKDVKELKAYVFSCNNNLEFVASLEDGYAWLFLPKETLTFKAEDSKRCNKFVKGDNFFGIKDQMAYLKLDGKTYHCTNNPRRAVFEKLKLQGYDFAAGGNEPGWSLVIAGDELSYDGDYGQTKYRFKKAQIDTNIKEKYTIYKADENNHKIIVKLEAKECADTMSDDISETTVTLTIDSKILNGCGKSLH